MYLSVVCRDFRCAFSDLLIFNFYFGLSILISFFSLRLLYPVGFQVPSRFIYYLLKKYLHVNSLIKDHDSASSLSVAAGDDKTLQRLRDFEVFDAQFDLLAELFFVFNWFEGTLLEEYQKTIQRALKGVSIFTGTMPTAEALAPRRKKKKVYKTRADFGTDDKYGNYVKNTLRQGMRVRRTPPRVF